MVQCVHLSAVNRKTKKE